MPLALRKKLLTIAALSLALSAGLGVLGWQLARSGTRETLTLAPGEIHEACFTLTPPERLEYRFETSHPAPFNLHYHDGDSILFPVPEHLSRAEEGVFTPESNQVYCLMWMNESTDSLELTLTYRLHQS